METIDLSGTPEDVVTEESGQFITLLKVGGNELDDAVFLEKFAEIIKQILASNHFPVIVHGGGKTIADYQERLGLEATFMEGLRVRVTDDESLDVAEMVLSGLMNKRIVRSLVHADVRAAGISGVDDGTIYVEPYWHPMGDLGRVGEVSAPSALAPPMPSVITSMPTMLPRPLQPL